MLQHGRPENISEWCELILLNEIKDSRITALQTIAEMTSTGTSVSKSTVHHIYNKQRYNGYVT